MLTGNELPAVGHPQSARTKGLLEKSAQYCCKAVNTGLDMLVDEAKGAVLKDMDGNVYIDFYGGIGVLNAGHCPDEVLKAIKEQADRCLHTFHALVHQETFIELAEKICQIAPIEGAKKAMLFSTGAEALENAVKISRRYTGKSGALVLDKAYHGRTLLTMSMSAKVRPYKYGFGPFVSDIGKIPTPYCYRCPYGSSHDKCGLACLEQIRNSFKAGMDPDQISCLVIESQLGEGGFIVPPTDYMQGLRQICSENDIVLILDEVQSGFCRSGKMFAVEHFGIEPDLMPFAKSVASGLPVSGVVGKAAIMDTPEAGQLGGTYAGNPVCCAAALATIDIYEKQKLWQRANTIHDYVFGRLAQLQDQYPEHIGEYRGLGAMIGVEIVKSKAGKEPAKDLVKQILDKCRSKGVIMIDAGIEGNVIRMLMPLAITDEQLAYAMDALEASAKEVLK